MRNSMCVCVKTNMSFNVIMWWYSHWYSLLVFISLNGNCCSVSVILLSWLLMFIDDDLTWLLFYVTIHCYSVVLWTFIPIYFLWWLWYRYSTMTLCSFWWPLWYSVNKLLFIDILLKLTGDDSFCWNVFYYVILLTVWNFSILLCIHWHC